MRIYKGNGQINYENKNMLEYYEQVMFKEFVEKQETLLKKYIQSVADENNVSFECAKAFIQKYMLLVFDVEEQDGKYFITLHGEFKPIEEVIDE